jgi:hypothetical protein
MEILLAVLKLAGCVIGVMIALIAYLFLVCKIVDN